MKLDRFFANARMVMPGIGVVEGGVGVSAGRIAAVLAHGETLPAAETVDCAGLLMFPGLIDPHVHFGFGSPETDFQTELRSAALGGMTTVISFHRSNEFQTGFPPALARAEAQSAIDFSFHFGLTSHPQVETLAETSARFGVSSYKLYMMYKGAAGLAKGFTDIDDGLLYAAMETVRNIPGGVLGVHCENVEVVPIFRDRLRRAGRSDAAAWDDQSPDFLEAENVHRVCYFAAKTGCPVNIVHLSSREALEEVYRHRRRHAAQITVETCPHYLSLTRDTEAGVLAKVNPPLRGQADMDALWEGVLDGTVTTVGTDHVPRKRETKHEIWSSTNGFPGVATLLPVLMSEGYHERGVPLKRIAAVTTSNVASLYNLPAKGHIAVGFDADLTLVDPDEVRVVEPAALESFADYSPYEGQSLKGWPVRTVLAGRDVMIAGAITEAARSAPFGRYIRRAGETISRTEVAG